MKKFRVGQTVRKVTQSMGGGLPLGAEVEIINVAEDGMGATPSGYNALRPENYELVSLLTEDEWDLFYDGKLVVNCRTVEIAREFLTKCEALGIVWRGTNRKPCASINYDHAAETCYRFNGDGLTFCYMSWYERENLKILTLPFSTEFTFDDVQTGMRAELRDGMNVLLIKSQGGETIGTFNDLDMLYVSNTYNTGFSSGKIFPEHDIMKIFSTEGQLLWERKRELTKDQAEQEFGIKIVGK